MKLNLIFVLMFLIFVSSVSATPVFVSINTNDQDNVYGVNDNKINLTVTMNSNGYAVYVDFSNIEAGANGTQKVINNLDRTYTINYTILDPDNTNPVNLTIVAFDPSDNSFTSNESFNVIMDDINPVIINQIKTPFIAFIGDDLILNATISDDFGIKTILITNDLNGSLGNYTNITNTNNNYSYKVNSNLLTNGQINWKYVAIDKANNVDEGNLVSSRLNNRTNISISPATPNGMNGWYISEPIITLLKDLSSGTTFFRFGNSLLETYTGPFNRTNSLNGLQELFYFTNFINSVSNRTEPLQKFTLYVDTRRPTISNARPSNNSITGPNGRLSALVQDIFLSNSGINLTSVKMFLDSNLLSSTVTKINNLSGSVNSTYNSLLGGLHNVTINAMDIAGNNASFTWYFSIDSTNISQLNVYSPENLNYNKSRILVNLSASEKASLYLFDTFDNKTKLLCSNCDKYANFLNFKDGFHNIKLIASDNASNNISKDVNLFVDSIKPVILNLNLRNNTVTNSSFFDINYNEIFLKNVKFYYEDTENNILTGIVLSNCVNGTNKRCNLNLNKNGLDGKTIVYYFSVEDNLRSVLSKKQEVKFDFSSPSLNILSPQNTVYNKKLNLTMISNEKLKKLSYFERGKETPLCTSCSGFNKTSFFVNGTHTLVFKAIDLVGNSNTFSRTFTVII